MRWEGVEPTWPRSPQIYSLLHNHSESTPLLLISVPRDEQQGQGPVEQPGYGRSIQMLELG